MHDGRLTRLAILSLLLLAPFAAAAPPSANLSSAESADGQDITDMAADPSGQFVMAVVAFDNAKLPSTGTLLGGTGTNPHDDIYRCDFGPSSRPTSGSGCRGLRHDGQTVVPATQPPNAPQRVAATSVDANGRQGVFAVVGPDRYVSLWRTTSDQPDWTQSSEDNYPVVNVTMSRDASRVIIGTAPTSPTAGGRVESRFGSNGTQAWMLALQSPEGGNVRPTSLDHSRTASALNVFVLAIGTSDGVLFADPATKPATPLGGLSQVDAVNKVALSADGKFAVIGASNGVFLTQLERSGGRIQPVANSVYNRGFGGTGAQDVAISLDGSRFAAAAGNEIHFFRRLDTAGLAEPTGTAYNAGARVNDIAYDEKGQILLAVAGNRVLAFGPNKNSPIWEFDATTSAYGALDGPLRKVSVSDDSQRILVAGKTKVMAYTNVLGVTASLASGSGATVLQPTQTATLRLTVQNTGSLPDNYTFSVVPPVGWTSTSADGVRLDPNATGIVTFNVTAPAGQAPGIYGTQVRVRSQAYDDINAIRNQPTGYIAGPSFNFTVPRSVVLKVEAPDDRVILRQGGEQTVAVTLRNEGNADGIVNLSARQDLTHGSTWDVRFQPGEQITVPASGSASVNVVIRPLNDAASGDRNIITLHAKEGDTVDATDQITAYVDAQFGAELRAHPSAWEFYPGQSQVIRLNVTNAGNTEDVYNLTSTITPASVVSDWKVTLDSTQITVARGETKHVTVSVKAVASDAREATLTLRAQSQNSPDRQEATLPLSLSVIPRPPTEEDEGFFTPAPGVWALLVGVALVAILRRGGRR